MDKLIFDSHAHYDDQAFDDDRDALLSALPDMGVCGIINCASDVSSAEKSVELTNKYSFIWASVGIHPHEASACDSGYKDKLVQLAVNRKVVAIGEIGLDYHYDFSPADVQRKLCEEQLRLAAELSLPVIFHDREAHKDTLDLLKKYKPSGIVHCFSGSVEMANEIVRLGMYIGLGGAVTFKNAKTPVEVAASIPLERILLETDAPYMTPVPFRGKRCHSGMIKHTAEKIAETKGISIETVYTATKENAATLFRITL